MRGFVTRCASGIALLAMSMLGVTTSAAAHAYVVATAPQANAEVATGPTRVSVSFDEPIALEAADPLAVVGDGSVRFACSPAAAVDPGDATRVLCLLPRPLPRGHYAVSWRVTSADTHVVHGTFAFGVGVAPASVAAVIARSPYDPSSPLAQALRFAMLYGSLVAVGALVFRREVAPNGIAPGRAMRRCTRAIAIGIAVAGVALLPALFVQALAAGATAPAIALQSAWGHAWLLRTFGLVLLAVVTYRGARPSPIVATIASVAVLASFSIAGHALDSANALVLGNAIADFAHLAGAAIWTGGVACFVVALPCLDARRAIAAFSPLAFAAVIAIVLSGTYASIVHVGSWAGLFDNTYGLLVVAKTVLLAALVALGARNLARGSSRSDIAGFARDLRIEATLLALTVALSAILTGVAPPLKAMPAMHGKHDMND